MVKLEEVAFAEPETVPFATDEPEVGSDSEETSLKNPTDGDTPELHRILLPMKKNPVKRKAFLL